MLRTCSFYEKLHSYSSFHLLKILAATCPLGEEGNGWIRLMEAGLAE
ncbi:hypothetical protein [uncultured Dialister sp.]|nr:hypothetical protein [uncultured Dialister sp.]